MGSETNEEVSDAFTKVTLFLHRAHPLECLAASAHRNKGTCICGAADALAALGVIGEYLSVSEQALAQLREAAQDVLTVNPDAAGAKWWDNLYAALKETTDGG